MNEKICILIQILRKFIPKGQIHNNPDLVKTMAWRRRGDKPLSEPKLTRFTDAYNKDRLADDGIVVIGATDGRL